MIVAFWLTEEKSSPGTRLPQIGLYRFSLSTRTRRKIMEIGTGQGPLSLCEPRFNVILERFERCKAAIFLYF